MADPVASARSEASADHWFEITRKISKGDSAMFSRFYDEFFDCMYVEAKRVTGFDESSCLDIVQESMIKSIRAIRPIQNRRKLVAFARTVVRSVAYDAFRKNISRRKRELGYEQTRGERSDDQMIDEQARMIWIEQAVARLDDDLRSIFHFRYRLGWSLAKIGQQIGLKTGAVDGRIRRALEKIKTQAKEQFGEP